MTDLDILAEFSTWNVHPNEVTDEGPELTCDACGISVYTVTDGSSLSAQADAADKHWRKVHGTSVIQVITVTVTAPGGTTGILEAVRYVLDNPQNYPDDADTAEWGVTVSSA